MYVGTYLLEAYEMVEKKSTTMKYWLLSVFYCHFMLWWKKNHCLKISYIQVLKWLDGYMSSRTLHLESTWYICTKQLTGGVISPTIIHPLNLWFVSRAIEFFMAMSHSGLEMRSFLNPFSNWHTSALPQPWTTWWLCCRSHHAFTCLSRWASGSVGQKNT